MACFSDLEGETLTSVDVYKWDDAIIFTTKSGKVYKMYHAQDCCERVYIEDMCGDFSRLLGQPVLIAEESSEITGGGGDDLSGWTFYKLATNKDSVTIRWCGSSNGFYSVGVDFEQLK